MKRFFFFYCTFLIYGQAPQILRSSKGSSRFTQSQSFALQCRADTQQVDLWYLVPTSEMTRKWLERARLKRVDVGNGCMILKEI